MSEATLTSAIELLTTVRESGLPTSQVKKLVELTGQKGLCDRQFPDLLQSPLYSDLLEAAKRSLLGRVDRMVFRHVLGLSPQTEELVVAPDHLINLDADPFVPGGWSVVEHQKGGQWRFAPGTITLYLTDEQKKKAVKGDKLREALKSQKVLNANVLDYLLAHPDLIPEEWKGKVIFFWGTVYRDSFGDLCVRCLRWDGNRWFWSGRGLDYEWYAGRPAAVSASQGLALDQ